MTKRILIEIPEQQYNNIMALDSACLGRIPYKGIVMYAVNAIKNGIPLPNEHGFIAVCKTDDLMSEEIEKELRESLFITDETCSYCYEITEIIKTESEG